MFHTTIEPFVQPEIRRPLVTTIDDITGCVADESCATRIHPAERGACGDHARLANITGALERSQSDA
jgi:hypothetical protein